MAIIGILSAVAIPILQIYFVETSDVTVEISSITRNQSDSANIALITDELEQLAASTKIIRYTSDQLITFPKEDQRMVNNFWRSTAWFRVYTMDTSQHVFTSNRVAFADNMTK